MAKVDGLWAQGNVQSRGMLKRKRKTPKVRFFAKNATNLSQVKAPSVSVWCYEKGLSSDFAPFDSHPFNYNCKVRPEMEKRADAADISVLIFLWLC